MNNKLKVLGILVFFGFSLFGYVYLFTHLGTVKAYVHTGSLLLGGQNVDTSNFPNRWETGMLFESLYAENPYIETESIANNGTHTFKSYLVRLPPFGHFQTRWYQVDNQEWIDFEEELNKPLRPRYDDTEF